MRVKWSQRWSRAAWRRSIFDSAVPVMGRAYSARWAVSGSCVSASEASAVEAGRVDLLGLDAHDHADLLGRPERVAVRVEVLLGEVVDAGVGTVLAHLAAAAHRDPLVLILRVDHHRRHARVVLEVHVLGAAARGVEDDVAVL